MNNKERFLELTNQIKRDGIKELMTWLESTDFYDAPASSHYHLSDCGGLLQHSLNVYDEMKRLLNAYPEIASSVTEESVIISSLFHDICKVNMYKIELKNRKRADGTWEKYESYYIDEKFKFGGHGSKSVFIIQQFMKLLPTEAVAINCHMGCWDGDKSVGAVYENNNFAWLLHVADESASYILEGKK